MNPHDTYDGRDKRKHTYNNSKISSSPITLSHIITTVSMAVAGLWFISGMAADISLLELEVRHQSTLRVSDTKQITKNIQELKSDVKEEQKHTREILDEVLRELRKSANE